MFRPFSETGIIIQLANSFVYGVETYLLHLMCDVGLYFYDYGMEFPFTPEWRTLTFLRLLRPADVSGRAKQAKYSEQACLDKVADPVIYSSIKSPAQIIRD